MNNNIVTTLIVIIETGLLAWFGKSNTETEKIIAVVLFFFIILIAVLFYYTANDNKSKDVNLKSRNIKNEKTNNIGLTDIFLNGSIGMGNLKVLLEEARTLRVMFVSSTTFINYFETDLVDFIKNGGEFTLLVSEPNGVFEKDIAEIEGREEDRTITNEINDTKLRLRDIYNQAKKQANGYSTIKKVNFGYFSTHLRVSIMIIDESYVYYILNLPPFRTKETPGFLLNVKEGIGVGKDKNLGKMIIYHYDSVVDIAKKHGRLELIG